MGYGVAIRSETTNAIVGAAMKLMPDVLVLDLDLQGNTRNIEIARTIHAVAEIPILFLSAYELDVLEN